MAAPVTSSTKKKSCCWLGHCCWLKCLFGLIVVVAVAGLYWKHIRIERELSALSSQLKAGVPTQLQTQLNTLDLLINMANVHFRASGDKKIALSYLDQAKKQAQLLPETPEKSALQQALNDDAQTIMTIEVMPLEMVSKKLDALSEQSRNIEIMHIAADKAPGTAPAAQVQATASPAVAAAATQQNKDWQEKLHEGWEQIKGLVKSGDKGASDNPVEAWLVPAKLGMQLEEIKLAAFYRNNDFFQKLINQTLDWLKNHYDLDKNGQALALKKELEAMKGWVIAADATVLSKSTKALDNLQKR